MSDEYQQEDLFEIVNYEPDREAEVVSYQSVLEELELDAPRIPAKELIGETFIILRASSFASDYKGQDHAWYCICTDLKGKERWATVFGGRVLVAAIDALAAAGFDKPLQVTLDVVLRGKDKDYYVFK